MVSSYLYPNLINIWNQTRSPYMNAVHIAGKIKIQWAFKIDLGKLLEDDDKVFIMRIILYTY